MKPSLQDQQFGNLFQIACAVTKVTGIYQICITKVTGSPGRLIAADMLAFSESVKSKFSVASARYKESISKSSQSLKENLLHTNSPVKELSRGVQREMSAGIAGVARIFERLDPTLKGNNDAINSNFFKGKRIQENVVASPVHGNSADTTGNVSLNVGIMHL